MMIGEKRLRKGLTLVELLVVVGIVVILAAIVLPSVKESIRDRKSTSASVQVRAFFDAARIRAMAKNREVAVVIERDVDRFDTSGNRIAVNYEDRFRNSGVRMSLAEVLPPYRGDFEDSVISWFASDATTSTFNLSLTTNPNASLMVSAGDLISFAGHSNRYQVISTSVVGTNLAIVIANPGSLIQSPQSSMVGYQAQFPINPMSFRVYGKPRRLFFKPVDLPKQMCVDLSLSGIGMDTSTLNASFTTAFSIPMGSALNATSGLPPLYISFGADGTISRIFTAMDADMTGTTDGDWDLRQIIPSSDVYLAIGKSEQIQSFPATSVWDDGTATSMKGYIGTRDSNFRWNLSDSGLQWVKISRSTGQVSNGPTLEPKVTPANSSTKTFAQMLFDARQGLAIGFESSAK